MAVSVDNKILAKRLQGVFCPKAEVQGFWDDNHIQHMAVLFCPYPLNTKVMHYGTIGLSDFPLYQDGVEYPIRFEIVGASYKNYEMFPNILVSAAFYCINKPWFCSPGSILLNAIADYYPELKMKHLYFMSPFLWENLETVYLETKTVAWVMAIPISEEENQYEMENGSDALEDLFERKGIDFYDLNRESAI